MTSFAVGQKIELNDGRFARIRFLGTTAFQTGEWIGVELDEATGKNDGSVKGDRYFNCEQGYGMFLRHSGVRSIVEDAPKPQTRKAPSATTVNSRPSSMHAGVNGAKRTDLAAKRASMVAASPTPGSRAAQLSGIRSPVKSPTKQLGSSNVSSTSTSRTSTPSTAPARRPGTTAATSVRSRPSVVGNMAPPARPPATATSRTTRPSMTGATRPSPAANARNPTARMQPSTFRQSRATEQRMTPANGDEDATQHQLLEPESDDPPGIADEAGPMNFAPPPPPPIPPDPSPKQRRGSSPPASVHSTRTARSTAVSSRHVEELEAKVRLLERKRAEDRDVKNTLEQAQQERDKYQAIIEKLQKKYQPQQQEIADLKKALVQAESQHVSTEDLQAEHESMLEMATLDKEMAEETADALRHELDALRSRQEEMEMELEVLRDENAEFSKDMSPEERTSAGWLQLEKENDRLRNALLRLRDLTQDREQELKEELSELRTQVESLEKVQTQFEDMRARLTAHETTILELREQLEAANDADNIIEELTDRNMNLNERISELRNTIEDLENIKELNDELEINHVEAEKQLQEEIDFKDALLLDRDRAAKLQQSSLDDADYTITKFRELVVQLQNDLQDMQASKQISEIEANELSNKSRAMMDLNIRLQTSAAKTQVKTIELELRRMDAEEASEHLAIVQFFLPDTFYAERDSVLALLRFKRISFKSNLIQTFIRERVTAAVSGRHNSATFAGIDVLNALVWIGTVADRFVTSICSCTIEDFAIYGTALSETETVEKALNLHIDALRRDEIKEEVIADELLRSVGVMEHLASLRINDSAAHHADEVLSCLKVLHNKLEGIALAFSAISTSVGSVIAQDDSGEEDNDLEAESVELRHIAKRADTLAGHARSAKVMIGKADRALRDLRDRSLTLDSTCNEVFDLAEGPIEELTSYCRQVGDAVSYLLDEEGRVITVSAADFTQAISRRAVSVFVLSAPEAGPFTAAAQKMRVLSDQVAMLSALPDDLDNCIEFERASPPWVARAEQLKAQKLDVQNTEGELARTREQLRDREAVVRSKNAELEEHAVRIETLEARMRDASKRSARIVELEAQVQKADEAERKAIRELEKSKQDAQIELTRVRDELSQVSERRKRSSSVTFSGDMLGPGAQLAIRRQDLKITSLQTAVRFLQDENHRLRMPSADAPKKVAQPASWLFQPLIRPRSDSQVKEDTLEQEGRRLLQDLLTLAAATKSIDLTQLTANKLAWRPAKASSRWQVEKCKEEWQAWRSSVSSYLSNMPTISGAQPVSMSSELKTTLPLHSADHRRKVGGRMSRPMSIDIKVPGSLPMN